MDYLEDFGEFTVIVQANGTVRADLVAEVVLDGDGISIAGCRD